MKTLELNQKIKVGKYECLVKANEYGYCLIQTSFKHSSEPIKQFIKLDEFCKKVNLINDGGFPYCETIKQPTQVVEHLKSFEKPEFKRGEMIIVWDGLGDKRERIFYDYNNKLTHPFICVLDCDKSKYLANEKFDITTWQFAEPIQQPKQITKEQVRNAFNCETFEIID